MKLVGYVEDQQDIGLRVKTLNHILVMTHIATQKPVILLRRMTMRYRDTKENRKKPIPSQFVHKERVVKSRAALKEADEELKKEIATMESSEGYCDERR